MIRGEGRLLRLLALVMAVAMAGVACGGSEDSGPDASEASTTTSTVPKGPDTTAAHLRETLNGLLQEHVYLASAATGATLGGRNDEFTAAAGALAANSDALTANMAAIFGADAGKAFDPLWKQHVTLVVTYAQGLAAKDRGRQDQAVQALMAYTKDFGAFINKVLPSLSTDTVADLVRTHIVSLKAVIDDQASGDASKSYSDLRAAAAHMSEIADPLAGAIAKAQSDKVAGDPASRAADLVNALNTILREHVYLVADATGAALGGRQNEFQAAMAALGANSDALTATMTGAYSPEVGRAFDPLWERHIGFLVDYTTGLAAKDRAKQDEAVGNLLQYTKDFGAFINTASPKLTKDVVAELVKTHIYTLKDIIDRQAAKDYVQVYAGYRIAADHMAKIADPLALTVVAQFPQKF